MTIAEHHSAPIRLLDVDVTIRRARTADVTAIRGLLDDYVEKGILLGKNTVTLYEDVQEFWVAEQPAGGRVVGCGAVHVLWEDLAEVRTVAVHPDFRSQGIGHLLLEQLLAAAREVGVTRVFVLTFEVRFFAEHGFAEIEGTPVPQHVYAELRRSYDEGVAEFLDLERVKPNTLGNTRMLRMLR
jgi:amino-acid N-acetyltransferase